MEERVQTWKWRKSVNLEMEESANLEMEESANLEMEKECKPGNGERV